MQTHASKCRRSMCRISRWWPAYSHPLCMFNPHGCPQPRHILIVSPSQAMVSEKPCKTSCLIPADATPLLHQTSGAHHQLLKFIKSQALFSTRACTALKSIGLTEMTSRGPECSPSDSVASSSHDESSCSMRCFGTPAPTPMFLAPDLCLQLK